MSEDITKELPMSMDEKIDQIFVMMRNVISGMNNLDLRMTVLEQELASLKAGTNPFWQVMHDQQRQILAIVQDQSARMDRMEARMDGMEARMDGMEARMDGMEARMDGIEAHLQQQDEKFAQWEERMDTRFRKLTDKFEVLQDDTLEWRADVRDLKRRVTRLEPIN